MSVSSKVLEKIVYKRLVSFLIRQNFFHKNQFGFRKKCSTSHATRLFAEIITAAFEKKQCIFVIFLDFSKAVDTIDHKILLQKLMHYGARGLPLEWFSSCLNDRTQQVLCGNQLSGTLKINCGVPQGSILGPLLFLIYVNGFSSCVAKGKTIMFADDTNLFFREKCYERVFQVANAELKSVDFGSQQINFRLILLKLITLCSAPLVANSLINILFNSEKKVSKKSLL